MVNLLSGGKSVNSGCKFTNFYLIVDGSLNSEISVPSSFRAFLVHLRSKFPVGKGGDSAFKVLADSSFFNAYPTVAESFRVIEEAISVSGANEGPSTTESVNRTGTALSGQSKKSAKNKAAAD
mmetsp:Transcript_28575/g.35361  ORF Transcript_28575/g.35361 Transcript_28575/m.35361 type:complete len:123 (+) Transcript_28575:906-1274(+)